MRVWHATREARMPVGNIYPGCIKGEDCNPGRQARPQYAEGFCWPCWASLTEVERCLAIWAGEVAREAEKAEQDAQPTEDWAVDDLLRALASMDPFDGDRHFRDAV